ncbi:MAG: hypothetical protein HC866_03200 [Leptolyngbyaceae cyanobacterium RU_5_1]|nr:hypothetical protein [Leptolyngbyaceae cyanobacterium RU_5_1]
MLKTNELEHWHGWRITHEPINFFRGLAIAGPILWIDEYDGRISSIYSLVVAF